MKKFDAIIALGGGIDRNGILSKASLDRADMAVDLHQQGIADQIITAGRWSHRLPYVPLVTEAAAMEQHALWRGVDRTAISSEDRSQDTIGNAYFIKRDILQLQGWRQLVLVTCLAHVARARCIFEHVLGDEYEVTVYPTLEISEDTYRHREALGMTALSQELAVVPRGDDRMLVRQFSYLTKANA